ncbi:MFS transporter [Brevibacillus sp. GCM10020057]|uniref:MFS transporter n=1 Tax=Brevibacillus sp. GCM10020057 TaxID=3317327 RepID=UPI0036345833
MDATLWKNSSFLKLWLAQLTANIGDQCYSFALLWYLLQATKSGTALSLLAIPEMAAGLMFYLTGGVLADRYSPRLLMAGTDAARIVVVISVGVMASFGVGQFGFFLAAQFLLGVFSSLFQPARTVALKSILPLELLGRANGILDTTFRSIRILAPMTIGLLAGSVPLSALFFANAASYLVSVFFVLTIRDSLKGKGGSTASKLTLGQYKRDIATGASELRHTRDLFYILLFGNLGYLVWLVTYNVGFPFLAERMDQGNGSTLAMLMGFYGIGNLLGSLYMARACYTRHLLVVLIGWMMQAAGFLLLTGGPAFHWLAFLGAALAGVGGPLIGIPSVTAIQVKATDANVGKVYAINMLMYTCCGMLSSCLGALWLGKLPVERLFLVSGLALVLLTVVGLAVEKRNHTTKHHSLDL